MKNNFSRLLVGYFVFCLIIGAVSAQDTYLESLQKINQRIDEAEKNIVSDINSFNAAFKDTFRLIDDEISRLILANAAMVGGVFAIMFLVYAKTTSRSRRDIQVLLSAHAKHIDNLIVNRMGELEFRIDQKIRAIDSNTLSKIGDDFDSIAKEVFDREIDDASGSKSDVNEVVIPFKGGSTLAKVSSERKAVPKRISEVTYVEEATLDVDGKAKILRGSSPGNRVLKRFKRGLLRLLGKNKVNDNVVEFKK